MSIEINQSLKFSKIKKKWTTPLKKAFYKNWTFQNVNIIFEKLCPRILNFIIEIKTNISDLDLEKNDLWWKVEPVFC